MKKEEILGCLRIIIDNQWVTYKNIIKSLNYKFEGHRDNTKMTLVCSTSYWLVLGGED